MSKRSDPWFKFYPADWRAEASLRAVSLAARALWMEMLCLMHEAEPRGHLLLNGRPMTDAQLAALSGVPVNTAQELLGELEAAGTFSRTRAGVIYSRRMRKDTSVSAKQRANVEKRWKSDTSQDADKSTEKRVGITKPDTNSIPKKPEARSQKEVSDANASSVGGADVQAAFDAWNDLARRLSLPVARDLTPQRRKAIKTRLASGGLERWREALSAVEASPHCRGENDRNWRADLDFVCQARSFQRLLEGVYGPTPGGDASAPAQPPTYDGPPELRAAVVQRLGEPYARSYIDRCRWDGPNRTLRAANSFAHAKLAKDLADLCAAWKFSIAMSADNDPANDRQPKESAA